MRHDPRRYWGSRIWFAVHNSIHTNYYRSHLLLLYHTSETIRLVVFVKIGTVCTRSIRLGQRPTFAGRRQSNGQLLPEKRNWYTHDHFQYQNSIQFYTKIALFIKKYMFNIRSFIRYDRYLF